MFGNSGPWEYLDLAIPQIEATINRLMVARPDNAGWVARKRRSDQTFATMYDTLADNTIEGRLHLHLVLLREPWRMR